MLWLLPRIGSLGEAGKEISMFPLAKGGDAMAHEYNFTIKRTYTYAGMYASQTVDAI